MTGITAIIPAAGYGTRMGSSRNKQFMMLCGKPVLIHTLEVFENAVEVSRIIVITREDEVEYARNLICEYSFSKRITVISGGKERQNSVWNGLQKLTDDCTMVVVHDGARPLLLPQILQQAIAEAKLSAGVVVGVPVKDTIKKVDKDGIIVSTPARAELWSVQTPQIFSKDILVKAYTDALDKGILATDDAALVERLGISVKMVKGSYENIKITTQEDLLFAEAILRGRDKG